MVRKWDYDDWDDTTEASLALEEVLRQWLEIEIVPGAEEQIRHASLGGTRGTEDVGEESDDSEGSDDEKGNDMPAASGANAGGTAASGASTDWVFTKRSGRLQILPWKAWQALYEQQVVAKMPGRERDLHLYHVVFGGASLLDVAEDEFSGRNLLSALRTIYATLGPQLWSLSEEDACRCMKNPARGIAMVFVRRVRRPVLAFPRVVAWGEPVSCGKRVPNIGQGPLGRARRRGGRWRQRQCGGGRWRQVLTLGEPGRHQGGQGLHGYPSRRGHGHICNAWSVPCA